MFDVRDFKIQSRDGNENVKKNVVVAKTTFQVRHTFWYISLLFLFDYDVKLPNFMFYGGSKQATDEILLLFLNLDLVPWNSTPGGFAYICKVSG